MGKIVIARRRHDDEAICFTDKREFSFKYQIASSYLLAMTENVPPHNDETSRTVQVSDTTGDEN